MAWRAAYRSVRIIKWLLWISVIVFSIYFMRDRTPHMGALGSLTHQAEAFLFGLPLAAVMVGLLELMLRDRAYPGSAVDLIAR
jgi:hypothetical protein